MIDAPDESARHSHAAGADDSSAPELAPPTTELANLAVAELFPPLDAPRAENVEASRERQRTLQGLIDKAIWTSIEGWAWDPKTPRKRIRLELVEDGTQLAMAVAGEDREDLALAGIGDGRHAFRIKLTPGLLSEGRHVLHLRCAETGAIVPGSPVVLESPAITLGSAFRWHVDGITDAEVTGWIFVRNEPSRHCVVALKEGGASSSAPSRPGSDPI